MRRSRPGSAARETPRFRPHDLVPIPRGMRKFLPVLALALASFTQRSDMARPTITLDPIPPVAGSTAKVTYSGPLPVTLTVRWRPSSAGVATIEIPSGGAATIDIPKGATFVSLTDPTNGADEEASVVQ